MLEAFAQRTLIRLLHVVDMLLRRNSKRELCNSALIGDCKIALINYVHPNQNVSTRKFSPGNSNTAETDSVR